MSDQPTKDYALIASLEKIALWSDGEHHYLTIKPNVLPRDPEFVPVRIHNKHEVLIGLEAVGIPVTTADGAVGDLRQHIPLTHEELGIVLSHCPLVFDYMIRGNIVTAMETIERLALRKRLG